MDSGQLIEELKIKDWQVASIEEVVKFIDYRGKTPQKTEDGMRLITAKNVKMGYLQREPIEFVEPTIYDEWMTRGIPKKGDVLFTTEAPLGNIAQLDTDEKVVFAQRIIVMQPNRGLLNSTFLKYLLLSNLMQQQIHEKGTGATVKGIKSQVLKKIQIAFPKNLDEQKRIVEILDEAFEGIDQAIRNTEKNLANARELFDSYLNKIFTQKGDGWEEKKIDDICRKVEYGSSSKSKSEGTIPVLRMGNIQNGSIDWSDLVYSDDQEEIEKYLLKYNDVLFNRTNSDAHVGKTAINKSKRQAIFAGYLIRIDYKKEIIDPDFLNFYLNSYRAREYGKLVMSRSVNQANINGTKLKEYPIPLPPLFLQKQIVENLVFLSRETKLLETIYRQKLAALNELKQSILQKAFTGQLTADTEKEAT